RLLGIPRVSFGFLQVVRSEDLHELMPAIRASSGIQPTPGGPPRRGRSRMCVPRWSFRATEYRTGLLPWTDWTIERRHAPGRTPNCPCRIFGCERAARVGVHTDSAPIHCADTAPSPKSR